MESGWVPSELTRPSGYGIQRRAYVSFFIPYALVTRFLVIDALSEGQMELRAASMFSGGFQDEVDYIAWNPTHPDLFCASGMKDRKIVFFDTRRKFNQTVSYSKFQP